MASAHEASHEGSTVAGKSVADSGAGKSVLPSYHTEDVVALSSIGEEARYPARHPSMIDVRMVQLEGKNAQLLGVSKSIEATVRQLTEKVVKGTKENRANIKNFKKSIGGVLRDVNGVHRLVKNVRRYVYVLLFIVLVAFTSFFYHKELLTVDGVEQVEQAHQTHQVEMGGLLLPFLEQLSSTLIRVEAENKNCQEATRRCQEETQRCHDDCCETEEEKDNTQPVETPQNIQDFIVEQLQEMSQRLATTFVEEGVERIEDRLKEKITRLQDWIATEFDALHNEKEQEQEEQEEEDACPKCPSCPTSWWCCF